MENSLKEKCRPSQTKFSFGATSAIITNLALITGLRTGGHAKLSIIAAMLVIALADNISDSTGIHVFQESECLATKEIWLSTVTNFLTRILVSFSFIFLIFFLPLKIAVVCSIIWGLLLLSTMSYIIAKNRGLHPYLAALEHIGIAIVVIIASNFAGKLLITKLKL
jgi:VIT1/CCC1 family predicted Fe2+/Mn2+ transporter